MTLRALTLAAVCFTLSLVGAGCKDAPGKPGPQPEIGRPEELVSFPALYQQNCSGCHGSRGRQGAAISLANPVYLEVAGVDHLERVTSQGVTGTTMPAFARQAGGMLTDQQIHVLAQGMLIAWSKPGALAGTSAPPYASSSPGDPMQGQKAFATFCARCHGTDATGVASEKGIYTGSLVDPAYLALVSDQSLRSTILAGKPEHGMPDWRSDLNSPGARPMTDEEITDTVAWIASHRVAMPGQPYPTSQH